MTSDSFIKYVADTYGYSKRDIKYVCRAIEESAMHFMQERKAFMLANVLFDIGTYKARKTVGVGPETNKYVEYPETKFVKVTAKGNLKKCIKDESMKHHITRTKLDVDDDDDEEETTAPEHTLERNTEKNDSDT